MSQSRKKPKTTRRESEADARQAEVRIIGGTFRGRRLAYHGDPVVRPMKHRTREAIFNLVSTECAGKHAIDLFAGTGSLGLEALSRGAARATFIEKHVPSARIVEENFRSLGVEDRSTLQVTSAFVWAKRDLPALKAEAEAAGASWLVFCSPPYAFYQQCEAEMLDLIRRVQDGSPTGSILIVEAEEPFDFELLRANSTGNDVEAWDVRAYAPAVVGIWRRSQA